MRHMDELNRLSEVKAPEDLKERTLRAARAARAQEPVHHPACRTGRCVLAAACAVAVLIGGAALWQNRPVSAVVGDVVGSTFGIVAYAADTGTIMEPQDSKIVFDIDGGVHSETEGFFTGCLFRVTGEDIQTVSASIDRGELYRTTWVDITAQQALESDTPVEGADITQGMRPNEQDGGWRAQACWKLGSQFEEPYDPDVSYGLWYASIQNGVSPTDDLQQAWRRQIDAFEGAVLTVTVTFTDGTQDTQTLTLHTGRLGVTFAGQEADVPKLTGQVLTEAEAKDTPYLYGIYADIGE